MSSIIIKNHNMLSNILGENNFNVQQLSHAVHHKAHGHVFSLKGIGKKNLLLHLKEHKKISQLAV